WHTHPHITYCTNIYQPVQIRKLRPGIGDNDVQWNIHSALCCRLPSIGISQQAVDFEPLQAGRRIAQPLAKFLSSLDDNNKCASAWFDYRIRPDENNGGNNTRA